MKNVWVYLWVVAIYVGTVLAVLFSRSHLSPPILELRNILIHSTGYAVLAGLIVRARDATQQYEKRRVLPVIAVVALLLGVGQEILQSVLRQRVFLANSLFDLCVDTGGAILCVLMLYRRANRRNG